MILFFWTLKFTATSYTGLVNQRLLGSNAASQDAAVERLRNMNTVAKLAEMVATLS